ncbi:MAG: pitrilysin family protein [Erysipelotrichaceae bacterium]|nr:pitrilysin family protein [Erysipelotrichaceae bacterium]
MQKITNTHFEETIYTEQLANGLHVIIWEKPGYVSSSALLAVPYGSLDYRQLIGSQEFAVPCGAAHFLEHKLFEDQDKDIMALFSSMGANVNAFTSYNETVYYFNTSSADITDPLMLLLDFVQELKISKESVEKEKGIITQELLMYKQMPDMRLFNETFSALYHEFPLKFDIGGSVDSVKATTKSDLETCYRLNYHPANMYLVVVTSQPAAQILQLISANQAAKHFPPHQVISRYQFKEPKSVVAAKTRLQMEVNSKKVCLAFKLPVIKETPEERTIAEWSLRFLMEAYFTGLASDYQAWLDQKLITDFFGYDIDISDDYALLMFYNEVEDTERFQATIFNQLKKITKQLINSDLVKQLQKRYYGQSVRLFNSVNDIGVTYLRSLFSHVDLFRSIELINEVSVDTIREAFGRIDLDNYALVEIESNGVK